MNDINTFLTAFNSLPTQCSTPLLIFVFVASLAIVVLYSVVEIQTDELKPFREQKRLEEERQKEIARQKEIEEAAKRLIEEGYGKEKRIELTEDGELVNEAVSLER